MDFVFVRVCCVKVDFILVNDLDVDCFVVVVFDEELL